MSRKNIILGESLKSKITVENKAPNHILLPSDEAIASKTIIDINVVTDLEKRFQSLQNISEHKSGKQISKYPPYVRWWEKFPFPWKIEYSPLFPAE